MRSWLIERYPRGHFMPVFNLLDPEILAAERRRKARSPSSTADHYRARGCYGFDIDGLVRHPPLSGHGADIPMPAWAVPAAPVATGAAIDLDAAIKHLQDKAKATSQGYCARYVRQAINAGGLTLLSQPGSAKNYCPPLIAAGYTALSAANYVPVRGDIFVMQPANGPSGHGHIAMFDGEIWISDFKQRDMWGGPTARKVKPAYVIYRP